MASFHLRGNPKILGLIKYTNVRNAFSNVTDWNWSCLRRNRRRRYPDRGWKHQVMGDMGDIVRFGFGKV
jgi:hypothetical protein